MQREHSIISMNFSGGLGVQPQKLMIISDINPVIMPYKYSYKEMKPKIIIIFNILITEVKFKQKKGFSPNFNLI